MALISDILFQLLAVLFTCMPTFFSFSGGLSMGRELSGRDFLYTCLSLTRLLSRSPEWANISESQREKLGLTFSDDGEFW